RAKVRVDLGNHIAGQESKFFSRFYGWSCENNAIDFATGQACDGHSHREIRFARPCGANAQYQVVVPDRFQITLLRGRFRKNDTLSISDFDTGTTAVADCGRIVTTLRSEEHTSELQSRGHL